MDSLNLKIKDYIKDIETLKSRIFNINNALDSLEFAANAIKLSRNLEEYKKRTIVIPESLQKHILDNQKDLAGCQRKIEKIIKKLMFDRRIATTLKKNQEKRLSKLKTKRILKIAKITRKYKTPVR